MACVPDPQPQQGGGGMSPTQAYQMYQQYGGGAGAGGSASWGTAAGFAPEYGAISPGIAAGADTGAGITTASGVTGGGTAGAEGLASNPALYANPYALLAAAIAGTAWGLEHNDVSSWKRQFQGKVGQDILESPNWNNHVPEDVSRALKPWLQDAHDPKQWKNIPGDLWDSSVKMPLEHTKKVGSWIKGLFD